MVYKVLEYDWHRHNILILFGVGIEAGVGF